MPALRFLNGSVTGSGLVQVRPRDVPGLRRKPGPVPEGWRRTMPSLLRYSDEQTVAGTAAVFTAIEAMGCSPDRFEDWGVVSASRFLGRIYLAATLRTFRAEGVWGISPHLIPHYAPAFLVGDDQSGTGDAWAKPGRRRRARAPAEGTLAALTWLASGVVPGVWLVLTGWSPEPIPERNHDTPAIGECQALALALTPGVTESSSNVDPRRQRHGERPHGSLLRSGRPGRESRRSGWSLAANDRDRFDRWAPGRTVGGIRGPGVICDGPG